MNVNQTSDSSDRLDAHINYRVSSVTHFIVVRTVSAQPYSHLACSTLGNIYQQFVPEFSALV